MSCNVANIFLLDAWKQINELKIFTCDKMCGQNIDRVSHVCYSGEVLFDDLSFL